ncbi:hypothetical protein GCM10020358_07400 [Amorphoplanes nipponensis]|uniref:Uncharacterized protein n=1 Tax=Actinoplanes nipponensis TaxID=135950 RepID=A0A919JBU8_9ACTN|nr:hypothetical protein [Actinoplanes nipponensis]GIE48104.1 hypothetical protein Ani05nite_16380 [Actinoplanes nipponensis]
MPATKLFRTLAGLSALAAATVFAWWVWLGRDTTMYLDPETGDYAGPYTTAQVAGLVLTLVALLVAAVLLWVPALPAAAVMTVALTAAWTVNAAREDETGLYLVGTIMVLVGMTAGTTVIALLTSWLCGRRRPAR